MGEQIGPDGLKPVPVESRERGRRRRPPEGPDTRAMWAFLIGLLALFGLMYALPSPP
jgi:hypothetical protein